MASERQDGWPDIEKELTCSICTDILFQPLTLLDCLHTFCGSCSKEWFAWQATAAVQGRSRVISNTPYTCPQCRNVVRDTKADWRLTTLLEGYLSQHPGRRKTEVEKEDMQKIYKPGDNVIPQIEVPPEQVDSEDERLISEVRALSMRDLESESGRRRPGRSRGTASHDRETHARSANNNNINNAQTSNTGGNHRIGHQNSLRRILSASPVHAGEVQEILESIYAEGVLDGIDLDNLTPEQEEALSEKIAEAYRRRQRRRDRSRNQERQLPSDNSHSHRLSSTTTSTPPEETRRDAHSDQQQAARSRPPISRPHLLDQSQTSSNRSHRRTHSAGRGHRSSEQGDVAGPSNPASRSATDLSERPRTAEAERERERRRRVSSGARSRTEPHPAHVRERVRSRTSSNNPTNRVRPNPEITSSSASEPIQQPPEAVAPRQASPQTGPSPADEGEIRSLPSRAAFAPEPIENLQEVQSSGTRSVSCSRCQRPQIQHELHYHCSRCRKGAYNICLTCYRDGQGCDHWFGFGVTAHERWRRLEPPEGWPSEYDAPHVLIPRRYRQPSGTTSPGTGLDEGAFCEICLEFCDDFYWSCAYCMEGAWGFCRVCVQQGKHCTHPLLPVSRITDSSVSENPTGHQSTWIRLPHLPHQPGYQSIADFTDCDICHRAIAATNTRYHCYQCQNGNYDICTECYYSLVATGKIRQSHGPNGWRKCLAGHRMVIVGYQDVPHRGFQRVTVRDPVGGWRWRDAVGDSRRMLATAMSSAPAEPLSPSLPPPADGSLGMRCLAAWNRFPGREIVDELSFPKNAEIREVETKNADWCLGVYAGQIGLFPSNHVRML